MKKIVIDYYNMLHTEKNYTLDKIKLDRISKVIEETRDLSADDLIEVDENVNNAKFETNVMTKKRLFKKEFNEFIT